MRPFYFFPARRAEDLSYPGEQQPEMVVDLGNGPDRGAGRSDRVSLLQGYGRPHVPELVHVRPVELFEEHLRVRGQGLYVSPLPLGKNCVKGQGRLARAGQTGDHGYGIVRDPEAHVLEVVLPGTHYDKF